MHDVDATEGVIWKRLLGFFFPILLGTLFQQLYNTADAVIVGRVLGKEALAAVGGGTGLIITLLIGFFSGLSSGASVVISKYYGAKEKGKVAAAIRTAVSLSFVGGIIVSVLGYALTSSLLEALGTPPEITGKAGAYLHIYFSGALFMVLYNMAASVFRAVGDSRTPFIFLLLSCLLNIALDLFFLIILRTGLEGAAYATVIAQAVSALLAFSSLLKRRLLISGRISIGILSRMLQLGLPAGMQSLLYTGANLIVQKSINSFGADAVAAEAAFAKLDTVFWSVSNSFGLALLTFTAQNTGAGKPGRARHALKLSFLILGTAAAAFSLAYSCSARYILLLFTSDPDVLERGIEVILAVSPWYLLYVPIEVLSAAMRGSGRTLAPTLIPLIGICVVRTMWLMLVPGINPSLYALMLCHPFSWLFTSLVFLAVFAQVRNRLWDT